MRLTAAGPRAGVLAPMRAHAAPAPRAAAGAAPARPRHAALPSVAPRPGAAASRPRPVAVRVFERCTEAAIKSIMLSQTEAKTLRAHEVCAEGGGGGTEGGAAPGVRAPRFPFDAARPFPPPARSAPSTCSSASSPRTRPLPSRACLGWRRSRSSRRARRSRPKRRRRGARCVVGIGDGEGAPPGRRRVDPDAPLGRRRRAAGAGRGRARWRRATPRARSLARAPAAKRRRPTTPPPLRTSSRPSSRSPGPPRNRSKRRCRSGGERERGGTRRRARAPPNHQPSPLLSASRNPSAWA